MNSTTGTIASRLAMLDPEVLERARRKARRLGPIVERVAPPASSTKRVVTDLTTGEVTITAIPEPTLEQIVSGMVANQFCRDRIDRGVRGGFARTMRHAR